MKWRKETEKEWRARRAEWQRWWAWHRVEIAPGKFVRWEWIERREIIWRGWMTLDYGTPPFYGDWYVWEYREPSIEQSFDELRELTDKLESAGQ